ncbi:MAG: translation initiation factor IF-2 [Candidatus Omnitrophica bacterium]|nr:translation initiation factor IF-2 [Candidatus Omnitrophota bacterium]
MRVHELAKALHLHSKDLLAKLKAFKIEAKGPMSTLDADAVNRARKALAKPTHPPKKPAAVTRSSVSTKTGVKAQPALVKTAPMKKPVASAKPSPGAPKQAPGTGQPTSPSKPPSGPALHVPRSAASAAGSTTTVARTPDAAMAVQARSARATAATLAPPTTPAPQPKAVEVPKPPASTKTAPPVAAPVQKTVASAPGKPQPPAAEPTQAPEAPPAPAGPPKQLELKFPMTVKDLADNMDVKASEIIKYLIQQKIFASIVQPLNEATVINVARAFHFEVAPQPTLEEQLIQACEPDPAHLVPRAPVVTFMGHVDHGKTSLLDAIRRAKVAEKEAGGITQHIGAYEVLLEKGRVTFLDTPGHEAFSALRARGANVTDVVVLVVAADDGIMPQTVEAIDHAKAAGVPIVVAINKVDKPEANVQKVKQQLTQYGLIGEDWGGKTIMVPVSAKMRQGIDALLEMLLLEAELLELKADPTTPARGVVIEAKQTKDRGPVATLLVQQGTLRVGETLLIGHLAGRVRAMSDARGHRIKEAGPARPVEVLGIPEVPKAGDRFLVVANEKLARQLAEQRREREEQRAVVHPKRITLQELHQRITEGQLKELRLILKADVQGSLEAIVQSLQKLDTAKYGVQFKLLHVGSGDINESDVILAAASDAILVGFHVGIEPKVQVLAVAEGVDVHIYQIIYELVGAITAAIEGLLEPAIEENFVGRAEVRRLFQVSKSGIVAGCMVTKGAVRRDCVMRVIRGRERLAETKIASLKRVKDDVREVQEGLECGILLEGNLDVQLGDLLEAWERKEVARKLS